MKVKQRDDDHKQLFALLNALREAMMASKGDHAVRQTLKGTGRLHRVSLLSEESLPQKTSYPSRSSWLPARGLVGRIEKFQRELDAGNGSRSIAMSDFLNDGLLNYIQKTARQILE